MNLTVIGLSHRTAPVEVRERVAVSRTKLGEATRRLLGVAPLHEAAILSTCNRVEIYGLTGDLAAAGAGVRRFLREDPPREGLTEAHLYEYHDRDAVRHLIDVVCGLDSMVVGETEILGQVKEAYDAAQRAGATGMALNRLFQKSFAAAKHIRSSTAITRGSTSVGSVAVELAEKIFRGLGACTVMVLGTGEMSEATARALHSRGAGQLLVCSRARERAETLAEELGGRAISYDQWPEEFPAVDIVISSTACPVPILTRARLEPLLRRRALRPLFLIDIAVPRDIERACEDFADVYLYDIDDLQEIAQQNLAAREREIGRCHELIAGHVTRFTDWFERNQPSLERRCASAATTADSHGATPVASPGHVAWHR